MVFQCLGFDAPDGTFSVDTRRSLIVQSLIKSIQDGVKEILSFSWVVALSL